MAVTNAKREKESRKALERLSLFRKDRAAHYEELVVRLLCALDDPKRIKQMSTSAIIDAVSKLETRVQAIRGEDTGALPLAELIKLAYAQSVQALRVPEPVPVPSGAPALLPAGSAVLINDADDLDARARAARRRRFARAHARVSGPPGSGAER